MVISRSASARSVARVLVCVFVASLSGPVLAGGHGYADDAEVLASGLVSPHPVEQFEGVRPPVDAEHCPLCHWLRAVGDAAPRPAATAPMQFDPGPYRPGPVRSVPARHVADDHASRAPPVR